VGTGANFPYYPPAIQVTAVDLSDRLLERARQKVPAGDGQIVALRVMDAQALDFPDATFDTVAATWVFCSVPDPILGLKEARRVLKPGGRLLLLEHVRLGGLLGLIMDLLNPIMVRLTGANINRRTVENVRRAGFQIKEVESHALGLVRLIEARRD
jgi:SAM-dependent methyltransferase